METGKIAKLYDSKGNLSFPLTSAKAVKMEDGITSLQDKIDEFDSKLETLKNGSKVNVEDFGAKGNGITPSGKFINDAIKHCKALGGGSVYIPNGIYIIETPVIVKDDICLYGDGQSTILKMKNNSNLECILKHQSEFSDAIVVEKNYNVVIKDIRLNGNQENNTRYTLGSNLTTNNGLILHSSHWGFLTRVVIENCGRDGIVFTGNDVDWNGHCTTNHLTDCSVFESGRYGVNLGVVANDNHFTSCQLGANTFDNIMVGGGSNSFTNCTIWGSTQSNGMYIGCPQTLVRGCNIEGNYHAGVSIDGWGSDSIISNCKFMSNSREEDNAYNHIFIEGEDSKFAENIFINGNLFLSSSPWADGEGITNFSIGLGDKHKGINISGNKTDYNNMGTTQNLSKQQIYGIKPGDTVDNVTYITSTTRPTPDGLLNSSLYCELDTGKLLYLNRVNWNWIELGGGSGGSLPSSPTFDNVTVYGTSSLGEVTTDTLEVYGEATVDSLLVYQALTVSNLTSTTVTLHNRKWKYDYNKPTTGTFSAGDIVYNAGVSPGGYIGWVCTTAGSPGTWKGFGKVEA